MRISNFMIAMLVVALFVAVFMNLFSEMNDKYPIDVEYNSSDWNTYNQLEALKNNTENIQEKTQSISEEAGALDVIGSYFSSAYEALKLAPSSVTSFIAITESASEDAGLGANTGVFKTVIITIVLVLIFVAIILSSLVKREL